MSKYSILKDGEILFEANTDFEIEQEIESLLSNGELETDEVDELEIVKNVSFSANIEVKYEVDINLDE